MSLDLTRAKYDPGRYGILQVVGKLRQHRKTPAYVKTSDRGLNACGAEAARQIHRSPKLVRLDADEADKSASPGSPDPANELFDGHVAVALVVRLDNQFYITKHSPIASVLGKAIKARQRVAWNGSAPPTDHIAVVVILRWLD